MKLFIWEDSAKQELRRIEQRQALDILKALTRMAKGEDVGGIKRLKGRLQEYYRLRFGDWRVLFKYEEDKAIHIYAVSNRRDVYRD